MNESRVPKWIWNITYIYNIIHCYSFVSYRLCLQEFASSNLSTMRAAHLPLLTTFKASISPGLVADWNKEPSMNLRRQKEEVT